MSGNYVVPSHTRNLRACMVCSVVQLQSKFVRDGCPNCEAFLDLAGHSDSVLECTSQVYEGLIALNDPSTSWVAKYQRLDTYKPGVYAVKVVGMLPDEVLQHMDEIGIRYVARDGSAQDDDA